MRIGLAMMMSKMGAVMPGELSCCISGTYAYRTHRYTLVVEYSHHKQILS